jgi:hypothetical protein
MLSDEALSFALIVRQKTVVAGRELREVESGAYLRALSVAKKMHDIAVVPKATIEAAPAQSSVNAVEQFQGAAMKRDSARFLGRTRHAVDAAELYAAPRELQRQDAACGPSTDNEHLHFTDLRHLPRGSPAPKVFLAPLVVNLACSDV